MKLHVPLFVSFVAMGAAQTPSVEAPKPLPNTVIATLDGKKVTYGEIEKYMRGLTPQMQQNAMRNRKEFIREYGLMLRLNEMAEKAKLDQKSPYKESLENARRQILTQAQISEMYDNFPVTVEQEQKYYDENKNRFEQVKLKVIYIPFNPRSATAAQDDKKYLTADEAKAKAERLVKEIKAGADFVKLVRENSEDEPSKAKDGDFGTFSRADRLPDAVRPVVFALKAGEVSEPVRQPNGFYVFRAESISEKPFSEVVGQIVTDLRNARLREWLESTTKSLDIKYEDEKFFSDPAAPAAAQVPGK
ncbi:MAG: peptidylprolyl isomerase [Acidobacteriia bacterium]|nr:peptidylprolyl isomerase [Terriglobia bacterium]